VTLDDALLARAAQLCGDLIRSSLLKEALRALLQREGPSTWRPWAAVNPPWSRSPVTQPQRDRRRHIRLGGASAPRVDGCVQAPELGRRGECSIPQPSRPMGSKRRHP